MPVRAGFAPNWHRRPAQFRGINNVPSGGSRVGFPYLFLMRRLRKDEAVFWCEGAGEARGNLSGPSCDRTPQ
jgi:hypothetical protein